MREVSRIWSGEVGWMVTGLRREGGVVKLDSNC